MLKVKRVYDAALPSDGFRVLVDRLWPRGLAKADACVDRWMKEIAPSRELRAWFSHDPARWEGFVGRYAQELDANPTAVGELRTLLKDHAKITLLYAAKDTTRNNAVALAGYLHEEKR